MLIAVADYLHHHPDQGDELLLLPVTPTRAGRLREFRPAVDPSKASTTVRMLDEQLAPLT